MVNGQIFYQYMLVFIGYVCVVNNKVQWYKDIVIVYRFILEWCVKWEVMMINIQFFSVMGDQCVGNVDVGCIF